MQNPLDEHLAKANQSKFEFYRDFINLEEAQSFVQLLKDNNIDYSLESSQTIIDTAIVGDGLIPKAVLKIASVDFKKVNEVIRQQVGKLELEEVAEHYLNQFENSELEEIFQNQEDWTIEDVYIAQKILDGRGVKIKNEVIENYRKQSLVQTQKGEPGNWVWMLCSAACIVFGLFINILLVLAGLGMSYYLAFGKNTDADGNNYFIYNDPTRQIGKIMLFGGIPLIILEFIFSTYILN